MTTHYDMSKNVMTEKSLKCEMHRTLMTPPAIKGFADF